MATDLPDWYPPTPWVQDIGKIIRVMGAVVNATLVLYTVPTGKCLYIFHIDLNVRHYAAGTHRGWCDIYDGTKKYIICNVYMPDAVDWGHADAPHEVIKVPAGWQVRVYANATGAAGVALIGVEFPA